MAVSDSYLAKLLCCPMFWLTMKTFHHKIGGPCTITIMHKFWRFAVQSTAASIVLVALTVVCYRLHFNLAASALLLMIVVVLLARVGSFFSSIFASIIVALCLAYVAPPAFSFRVDVPLDDLAIIVFLSTSFIIALHAH